MIVATTVEWVSAIAESGAALGTFTAVWVTLRQVRRQDRRNVTVTCQLAVTPDEYLVALRAVNDGPKPVELTMAYLETDDHQTIVSPLINYIGDRLPKMILEGQSAEVFWKQSALFEAQAEHNFEGYLYAYFMDTLGNMFVAEFPGTTEHHKWRRFRDWPYLRRVPRYELPERNPLG